MSQIQSAKALIRNCVMLREGRREASPFISDLDCSRGDVVLYPGEAMAFSL